MQGPLTGSHAGTVTHRHLRRCGQHLLSRMAGSVLVIGMLWHLLALLVMSPTSHSGALLGRLLCSFSNALLCNPRGCPHELTLWLQAYSCRSLLQLNRAATHLTVEKQAPYVVAATVAQSKLQWGQNQPSRHAITAAASISAPKPAKAPEQTVTAIKYKFVSSQGHQVG